MTGNIHNHIAFVALSTMSQKEFGIAQTYQALCFGSKNFWWELWYEYKAHSQLANNLWHAACRHMLKA